MWVLDGATGLAEQRVLPGPSDALWLVEQRRRRLARARRATMSRRQKSCVSIVRGRAGICPSGAAPRRAAGRASLREPDPAAPARRRRRARQPRRLPHRLSRCRRRHPLLRHLRRHRARRAPCRGGDPPPGGRRDARRDLVARPADDAPASRADERGRRLLDARCSASAASIMSRSSASRRSRARRSCCSPTGSTGWSMSTGATATTRCSPPPRHPASPPLLDELRAIEAADPACRRYPRLKPRDDATAVLVRPA